MSMPGFGADMLLHAPAAGGAPALPTANLSMHLRADLGTWQDTAGTTTAATSNGDPVGRWADQSGNGRHLNDNSNTSYRPALQNSVINGHPVIRFNGSSHGLYNANLSVLTAAEVFIIVKVDTDPPGSGGATGFWDFGNAGSDTHFPWTDGVIYDHFGTNARKSTVDPTPSLSASFRLYNVVSTSSEWTSFLDGTQLYTTGTNGVAFRTDCSLGSNRSRTYFLDGDIAELVIYSAKLSAGDKADAEAYFADRYGLTIA
jgi:hypothetical protein